LTEREKRLKSAGDFIDQVKKSSKGDLAVLKRNAGNSLAEARGAFSFYRYQSQFAHGRDEEIYFLVATLVGYNKHQFTGDLGKGMRELAHTRGASSDAVERRFLVLLDSDFDRENGNPYGGELAFRLRQVVKQLASKNIGIDWAQLLVDLCAWGMPQKHVQKRWASDFYGQPAEAVDDTYTPVQV
jgi:CRISPR type I-E-associated protein CasB/Cse2